MLTIAAQLRRLTGLLPDPSHAAALAAQGEPLQLPGPAQSLDRWQDAGAVVPLFLCERTGAKRTLSQPVLVVPSGHSMAQAEAIRLGQPFVANRLLRQAMQRLVDGEVDWDEAVCPITLDSFVRPVQIASPVIAADTGRVHHDDHTYELAAIEAWLVACGKIAATLQTAMPSSPLTRAQLRFPVRFVANIAIADMTRARAGLAPLSEAEQRALRRACHDAAAQLNRMTGESRRAFHVMLGCILGGAIGTATIEWLAHRPKPVKDLPHEAPPGANDTAFWSTCVHGEPAGAPEAWLWTPAAMRHGCASHTLRCRQAAIDLVDDLCATEGDSRREKPDWARARLRLSPDSLRCLTLRHACQLGTHAYYASPDYHGPPIHAPAQVLRGYHAGALAVLVAGMLGFVMTYQLAHRRRTRFMASPV